jgi:hypothetical protein
MKKKLTPEELASNQIAASRAWKARNKEMVKEYSLLWRQANKEYAKQAKKEWDAENKDRRKEYDKNFKTKNPDYFKNKHLESTYGIPIEEYDRMLHNQRGRCAVCGKHAEETHRKRLFVDHSHATGKIRALLCQQCNTALGMVKEDTDILFALVAYLEEHR